MIAIYQYYRVFLFFNIFDLTTESIETPPYPPIEGQYTQTVVDAIEEGRPGKVTPNLESTPSHTHTVALNLAKTHYTNTTKSNPTLSLDMTSNDTDKPASPTPSEVLRNANEEGETHINYHNIYVTREDKNLCRYNCPHNQCLEKSARRLQRTTNLIQVAIHTVTIILNPPEEEMRSVSSSLLDSTDEDPGNTTPDTPIVRNRHSSESEKSLSRQLALLNTADPALKNRQRRDSARSAESARRRSEREASRSKKRGAELEPGQRTLLDLGGSQPAPKPPAPNTPQTGDGARAPGSASSPKPDTPKPPSKNERKKEKKGKGKKRSQPGAEAPDPGEGTSSSTNQGKRPRKVPTSKPLIPEDFVAGEATISLSCTKPGAGEGAGNTLMGELFMAKDTPTDIVTTSPIPDGLTVEVTTEQSVAILKGLLEQTGWTVKSSAIWPRFGFTAPAPLAGPGPDSPNLSPKDIVLGLERRNNAYGLPTASIRYVSHNWETVEEGKGKGGPLRLRVYVDVSPEGVKYLEQHNFFMKTLVYAVRLKPCPRSRH